MPNQLHYTYYVGGCTYDVGGCTYHVGGRTYPVGDVHTLLGTYIPCWGRTYHVGDVPTMLGGVHTMLGTSLIGSSSTVAVTNDDDFLMDEEGTPFSPGAVTPGVVAGVAADCSVGGAWLPLLVELATLPRADTGWCLAVVVLLRLTDRPPTDAPVESPPPGPR